MSFKTVRSIESLDPKARGEIGYFRWTLCIGSGVSYGVVPTWNELARRVINESFGASYSVADFQSLMEYGWSMDGWIQAAANHHLQNGGDRKSFNDLLRRHLYSDLLAAADKVGLKTVLIRTLLAPRETSRSQVRRICEFFEDTYSDSSLVGVVKWLIAAQKRGKLPMAVISFNAEPLLHTLFELFQRREHYQGPPPHSHPDYCFARVIRPNFVGMRQDPKKISFYHCHGALLPKHVPKAKPGHESIVFLEEDYLNVSTRAATWPQTLFMFYASQSRMVFVGFSMSDPNIRRWLGISQELAIRGQTGQGKSDAPPHLWITRKPLPEFQPVLTEGLLHLGVRSAWISEWTALEAGLSNLTAAKRTTPSKAT
jgi:SIR2-like domain